MGKSRKGRQGFIYSPMSDLTPLNSANVNDIVKIESAPPWIVVDHAKHKIILTNWPGVLWAVEVIKPAPETDQVTDWYTRSTAIRLIEQSSTTELFGKYGENVERILDSAASFQLSNHLNSQPIDPSVEELYSDGWTRWLKTQQLESYADNHRRTLAMEFRESPIGPGLLLASTVIDKRAQELEGDAAFAIDDEGEIFLVPRWMRVSDAARHAAMANGAPHLFSTEERAKMTACWHEITNAP